MRLVLPLLLFGCAAEADNALEGSLADFFDLSFDQTRARLYDSELSIEYVDSVRGDLVVLRVTLTRETALVADVAYDLQAAGSLGMSDSVGSALPPVLTGTLAFEDVAEAEAAVVEGWFDATLEPQRSVGLAVQGRFLAEMEVVDDL